MTRRRAGSRGPWRRRRRLAATTIRFPSGMPRRRVDRREWSRVEDPPIRSVEVHHPDPVAVLTHEVHDLRAVRREDRRPVDGRGISDAHRRARAVGAAMKTWSPASDDSSNRPAIDRPATRSAGLGSLVSRSIVIGFEPSALATTMIAVHTVELSVPGLRTDQPVCELGPVSRPASAWTPIRRRTSAGSGSSRPGSRRRPGRSTGTRPVRWRPVRTGPASRGRSRPTATATSGGRQEDDRPGRSWRALARPAACIECSIGIHHSGRSQAGSRRERLTRTRASSTSVSARERAASASNQA